ncbi:MAG: hypothetical protein L3I99_03615 [Sulfurimonas sp.]|nr:hypothetical protein [Sulfurimonas sp.]
MKYLLAIVLVLLISGCEVKDVDKGESSLEGGMKCGAGKCGANMFDGNSALEKKKKNMLEQMRDNDSRKSCVINAKTTKEAYDCVRDKDSGILSVKCGTGKCGTSMTKESAMKCAPGKCGGSMEKESVMKCAPGKCGG